MVDIPKLEPMMKKLFDTGTITVKDFNSAWNINQFFKRRGFKTSFLNLSSGYIVTIKERPQANTIDQIWSKIQMEGIQKQEDQKTNPVSGQSPKMFPEQSKDGESKDTQIKTKGVTND